MSFKGFNFNNEDEFCGCDECTCEDQVKIDAHIVNVDVIDGEELLNAYFPYIVNAQSEEGLYEYLHQFMCLVEESVLKNYVIEQIKEKIGFLNLIQNGE
jgi:hypothetical protein